MLVEIKINGIWYRFTTSWWSNNTFEFTCISEDPTEAIKGKRFTKEYLKDAEKRGVLRFL